MVGREAGGAGGGRENGSIARPSTISGMKISDLGEFALIDRLTGLLSRQIPREDLIVGPGDDAAVYRFGGEFLIATTDTMVEGVHFLPGAEPQALGWKAMAVNISDIAAMGGWPVFSLVTLALPPEAEVGAIEALYEGLRDMAMMCAAPIIGGDTVRAPEMAITVTVAGRAEQRDGVPLLLRRDAAKPGDAIAVTGTLGDSAAGLRQLREGGPEGGLTFKHERPQPRLGEGAMAVEAGVRCGIDVSDGLLADIGHICERSKVGAVVRADDVPLSAALRAAYPADALRLGCTGGEDYELVLAGPREVLEAIREDAHLTFIGEIVKHSEPRARLLGADGKEIGFKQSGWDAFKS